jgi:Ran GTPase-activating protein (RanGAP) involved in mRNA processing and transport
MEEVQRLALWLQSQPHVTHLNLRGHTFGPEGMRLLAGPIALQTSLHTLNLCGT